MTLYHLVILASKASPETRKLAYWKDLYVAYVGKEWLAQARKILQKELPKALYESLIKYRRTLLQ